MRPRSMFSYLLDPGTIAKVGPFSHPKLPYTLKCRPSLVIIYTYKYVYIYNFIYIYTYYMWSYMYVCIYIYYIILYYIERIILY